MPPWPWSLRGWAVGLLGMCQWGRQGRWWGLGGLQVQVRLRQLLLLRLRPACTRSMCCQWR